VSTSSSSAAGKETYAVEDVRVVETNAVNSILSFFIGRCHGAEPVKPAAATIMNPMYKALH